uniref:peptidoglycan glycosyltransferase n=1 Tax=Gloeochaete wittrockiana TaxID=38269 RepID=A0A3G1IVU9_9EUKA|nr:plastid division protein [Gloeochaete wittrockiana]YP_009546100.1 plastid division protein [Gloeochaete wittrockiana]ASQ40136.1 plastid division protein [Gloeochaete wittrockiana]ASQ40161.1 plastid division protein [Gloeochaete wittrockiana]|eukprot:TRINITY_DN2784_c1_g2_i1.p1 TRINITY_DN2784_c1_g2~~TRINITY_DN2784_c1_g2_i1.p1  ORF type:complete len:507 (+),score=-131.82 TRINITY_DN2784_c1_g2_i1:177-1697(+)
MHSKTLKLKNPRTRISFFKIFFRRFPNLLIRFRYKILQFSTFIGIKNWKIIFYKIRSYWMYPLAFKTNLHNFWLISLKYFNIRGNSYVIFILDSFKFLYQCLDPVTFLTKKSRYFSDIRALTMVWFFIGVGALLSSSSYMCWFLSENSLQLIQRQLAVSYFSYFFYIQIQINSLHYCLEKADLGLAIGVLVLYTLVLSGLGVKVGGATRWFSIRGLGSIQPSEVIKPFWVLQISNILGRWHFLSIGSKIRWLMIFCLTVLGILLQPNLSTAMIYGMTLWFMSLVAGLNWKLLTGSVVLGLFTVFLSVKTHSYQFRRILIFLDPFKERSGLGYQLVQSLIAIGTGKFFGKGYGKSLQKTGYLPLQSTDFAFSIFAEEGGFFSSLGFLWFLLTYVIICFEIVMCSKRPIKRLVVMGSMFFLIFPSIIHIGVCLGILPTTGLPMPFLSYGVNCLFASIINAGLIARVASETTLNTRRMNLFVFKKRLKRKQHKLFRKKIQLIKKKFLIK